MATNPWTTQEEVAVRELADAGEKLRSLTARDTTLAPPPHAGHASPSAIVNRDVKTSVWWLGAHGGAGESTLEHLVTGSRAAGHAWPTSASRSPRVVLVARTHALGLQAAQALTRRWADGHVDADVLGLALIADVPGKLPKPLKELCALLAGGVPRSWELPYVSAWRLGDPVRPETAPRAYRAMAAELRSLDAHTSAVSPHVLPRPRPRLAAT